MATQPSPSVSPIDVTFDGNPLDLKRVLAAISFQILLHPSEFAADQTKSLYLCAHFRGHALDWASGVISRNLVYLDNYQQFCARLETAFGYDAAQAIAIAQTQLGAMRQTGDIVEFLVEFDDTCSRAGVNSDTSKITLLMPKLNTYYRDGICRSGDLHSNYSTVRTQLCNIASRTVSASVPNEKKRKKAHCGTCGRKGHTAAQCVAKN